MANRSETIEEIVMDNMIMHEKFKISMEDLSKQITEEIKQRIYDMHWYELDLGGQDGFVSGIPVSDILSLFRGKNE